MEWNTKSPSQWDWEHLFFFNAKETENIPKLQQPNLSGEANREINAGLCGKSCISGCSGSELIHASSSRSPKSASINSSSYRESKTSMFTFEESQDDSSGKKELPNEEAIENSHALDPSSASAEPLLTLKLGKRFYFKDVGPGSDSKNISSSEASMSSLSMGKKSKFSGQNLQCPRCQVEGCGLDLSSAKDYHRKHRVCENHAKSPKVVIAGFERRFCQQCSRFHGLSEFDEKKRSCRRRLSDHNARRRKPHPEALQLNQSTLSSSPFAGRGQMSPFTYSSTAMNSAWQDNHSSKLPQTKDFLMKPAKANNELPSVLTMISDDSNSCFTSKGITNKNTNPGVQDSITSCAPNATQDFHRALSLLSTNSWGSFETKSISLEHSTHTTSAALPITHAMSQCSPVASPQYWHNDPHQVNSGMWISYSNCDDHDDRGHEFQLFREPYESGFPYDQLD